VAAQVGARLGGREVLQRGLSARPRARGWRADAGRVRGVGPVDRAQREAPVTASVTDPVQVVWFKRDLRLHDHAPLRAAAERGPVLPLYVWEPELLHSPEYDAAHGVFVSDCLAALRDGLGALGLPLCVLRADLPDGLEALWRTQPFAALWSHEETGQWITFQRDLRVAAWCRERGVAWTEIPQNGVVRRLRSRDGWARRWDQRMLAAETPALRPGEARAAPVPGSSRVSSRPLPTRAPARGRGCSAAARRARCGCCAGSSPSAAWTTGGRCPRRSAPSRPAAASART
jgi:deoxyribodipyrimidine photo-lyase